MDRYYSPDSPEALAHAHIKEYIHHDPRIGPDRIGNCAAYAAIERYVTRGDELYIAPTDPRQLQSLLRSYAVDVIHSLISQSRTRIHTSGYGIARNIAEKSIDNVLRDHAEDLVALYSPRPSPSEPVHAIPSTELVN